MRATCVLAVLALGCGAKQSFREAISPRCATEDGCREVEAEVRAQIARCSPGGAGVFAYTIRCDEAELHRAMVAEQMKRFAPPPPAQPIPEPAPELPAAPPDPRGKRIGSRYDVANGQIVERYEDGSAVWTMILPYPPHDVVMFEHCGKTEESYLVIVDHGRSLALTSAGGLCASPPSPETAIRYQTGEEAEAALVRFSQGDCCRVCVHGLPCGDSCIAAEHTCHVGDGCAC